MILGLQLIAILFSFAMIYLAFLNYKRREIDKTEFLSWIIIWTLTLFVVIFPGFLRNFAQYFFITRLFDLMVVGAFILVISMTARIYVKVRKMEKKFEDFIRKEALKNINEKSEKKNK